MAVTASGLYYPTWSSILNATQLAVNLLDTGNKVALFTNTITPNFSTDTAYGVAPYNAGETSGTGYTAGGKAISTPTVTESPTGTLMFDMADLSWTTATFTAHCALLYANLAGNNAIVLADFGADYSPSAGTFTIQWAATGVFTIQL